MKAVCLCLFLHLLYTEYQNLHSTTKVRTFLGREYILAGPDNFKEQFES